MHEIDESGKGIPANIGAAHVTWPVRCVKNLSHERQTREQDAGRIVDIHPSLDPRSSTTDVQLQFGCIGHVRRQHVCQESLDLRSAEYLRTKIAQPGA